VIVGPCPPDIYQFRKILVHLGERGQYLARVLLPVGFSVADQVRNFSMSAAGTPSNSQITCTGSGREKLVIRSAGWGRAVNAPMSSLTIAATRGRSASIRRTVNALATSLRSRVCSGGPSR
jgi:hypothetical protein